MFRHARSFEGVECTLIKQVRYQRCSSFHHADVLVTPVTIILSPLVLVLEKNEVTKTEKRTCGWLDSRRTYGELGAVDKSRCAVSVSV